MSVRFLSSFAHSSSRGRMRSGKPRHDLRHAHHQIGRINPVLPQLVQPPCCRPFACLTVETFASRFTSVGVPLDPACTSFQSLPTRSATSWSGSFPSSSSSLSKFQRRDVWSAKAKSFLIDTIIRQMPISPIFLRLKLDPVKRKMVREVVDGQQRLRAILGFVQGDFHIMKAHNAEFANANYSELPEEFQRALLAYKLPVYSLENISDADVLRIFARMNTYTEPLKAQELMNAEFFGAFKQAVYELAFNHYPFWINCNILTTKKIARMADAELVSELIVCILDGIRQTKTADLRQFYARYDDEFPQEDRVTREFNAIIDVMGNAYADKLIHSPFRRIPLFFTLFLVVYDAMYGLPN